jgi:hypothetical protein
MRFLIVKAFVADYNPRLMHIILKNGLTAAKKNIIPGLILQGFALALVLLYYFHEPTRQVLLKIPEIKQQIGILFPLLVTAFFGGLIPFVFLAVQKEIPAGRYLANLIFLLGLWALYGIIIDFLYKAQAIMFGDQPDIATVVKKVLFDQFVFCTFFSAPFSTIAMHWKQYDFSFKAAKEHFSRRTFAIEIPSVLLAMWAVWIPTVAIVYSLPLALQFPLFNIVLCFWSLLLTAVNQKRKKS